LKIEDIPTDDLIEELSTRGRSMLIVLAKDHGSHEVHQTGSVEDIQDILQDACDEWGDDD
jgi:hypothetical protein